MSPVQISENSFFKKILFKLIGFTIGCLAAIILGEIVFTVYSFVIYKTISVQELLDREKDVYVIDIHKENKTYLESLFPHPYLAFVHRKLGRDFINNIGLEGRDFPLEKDASKFTILITGGSVANYLAQNVEGQKNFIEDILNSKYDFGGKEVVVLNGANGAWKQPHQAIMLMLYGEVADALINLDGFNEHYMVVPRVGVRIEYPANDFHKLNPLVETGSKKLAISYITSSLYGYSRKSMIIKNSRLFYFITRFFRNQLQMRADEMDKNAEGEKTTVASILSLPKDWPEKKKSQFNIEQYKKYIRLMTSMARELDMHYAFFIQPVPAIGKKLTEEEKTVVGDLSYRDAYQKMTDELLSLRNEQIPVFSLLDLFSECEETIYRDHVHYIQSGPRKEWKGYPLIAEKIVSIIEDLWNLKRL